MGKDDFPWCGSAAKFHPILPISALGLPAVNVAGWFRSKLVSHAKRPSPQKREILEQPNRL
jgi:hypothetical protein